MELKQIIGDYVSFFNTQRSRLNALDIDISGYAISHIAYRTETYDEYVGVRDAIEKHCSANVENVWNGRPMSKLLLSEPLDLGDGFENSLIELIPPVHQNLYKMGLEHIGFVVGDGIAEFGRRHRTALTGQQFHSPVCEPYYLRFDDHTMAKFYQYSLMEVCIREGRPLDGFHHADDYVVA